MTERVVHRPGLTVASDTTTRVPRWVLEVAPNPKERVVSDGAPPVDRARSRFRSDGRSIAPRFCAHVDHFRSSGFDRGHMAPAASFKHAGQEAMDNSFFLTNVAPQVGRGMNRDFWERLERFGRRLLPRPTGSAAPDAATDAVVPAGWRLPGWRPMRVHTLTGPLSLPLLGNQAERGRQLATLHQQALLPKPWTPRAEPTDAAAEGGSPPAPAVEPGSLRQADGWNVWLGAPQDASQAPWVAVPTHFFKVFAVELEKDAEAAAGSKAASTIELEAIGHAASTKRVIAMAAFVVPNQRIPKDTPLTDFLVPITTLETLAGFEVFPRVLKPSDSPHVAQFAGISGQAEPWVLRMGHPLDLTHGDRGGKQPSRCSRPSSASPARVALDARAAAWRQGSGRGDEPGPAVVTTASDATGWHVFHLCDAVACELPPPFVQRWHSKPHGAVSTQASSSAAAAGK